MNKITALYDALEFLASLSELDEMKIWSRILDKIAAALDVEAASYLYFDQKFQKLMPHYSLGVPPDKMQRNPVAPGEGLCGWVAKFHQPLLVADAAADKRFRKDIDEVGSVATRSAIYLPLLDRLDLVGVMGFFNKGEGPFAAEDLQLAQSVCQHTALTIRRLRLEGMVHRVTAYNASILDNLSGGFLAVDLQGRLMICNPAARRILGVNGDITDVPVEKALPQLPELATVLRQTLSSKQIVRRKELDWMYQNEKRRLGYSTLLIQDPQGRFVGAGITFQDLTQLKQ